jgi:glycosyltransferase involved in cell wall biosynthesis
VQTPQGLELGTNRLKNVDNVITVQSSRSKVLFIIPGPLDRRTGGSIYNQHLARHFEEREFQVEVVSVPDLPYFLGLAIGILVSPWLLLKSLLLKPDVVIEDSWAHPALILFNLLTAKSRLVLIAHTIRCRDAVTSKLIASKLEGKALRSARLIIAVSRFIKDEIDRLVGSEKPVVVARPGSGDAIRNLSKNGESSRAVSKTADDRADPLRLLFAGSCVEQKGVQDLIEALALIRDLPLLLDLAGRTDVEPRFNRRLTRLIDELDLSERVTFHGLVDSQELVRLYASADIFVFPSRFEGYGIVLAEAMRAGLPIVAANNGPVGEIVADNENALIVPTRDSKALAGAIRKLAEDSEMRERYASRSRDLAEHLPSWRNTCELVQKAIGGL